MVGDGYAMGVAAQILEHKLWATERAFRINHPVVPEQRPEPGGKGLRLSERLQASMEIESGLHGLIINYEAVVFGNRPINEKTGTRISLSASASGNPSSVNRRNASVVSSS